MPGHKNRTENQKAHVNKGRGQRGNGPGLGSKGDGWGGLPQGASTSRILPGDPDGIQAMSHNLDVQARSAARIAAMKDKIYGLAENAQREETQLSAAIAFLNQELGMPIQRSINANVDDPAKVVIVTGVTRAGDEDR